MAEHESRWQRRIQAADSATRLLTEAGLPLDQPVDVFGLCESLGLWLVFFPMDGLLGAFIPEGAGGVMITTQRPQTIQRYTAAHEIGHWRLDHGHGLALDGEEHILGRSPNEREQLAQIFAANLLMPPPLIHSTLARLGATASISPEHAYGVAREAGVSYEAAVRQLENLGITRPSETATLLDVSPLRIKTDIAHGRRPDYGWADVWKVDEKWDQLDVAVHLADEVVISLPENRSTGYRWMAAGAHNEVGSLPGRQSPPLAAKPRRVAPGAQRSFLDQLTTDRVPEPDSDALPVRRSQLKHDQIQLDSNQLDVEIVGDVYLPAAPPPVDRVPTRAIDIDSSAAEPELIVGGNGRRVLGVRFNKAGRHQIHLEYRDRYSLSEPFATYSLIAEVSPKRSGISVDQLVQDDDHGQWTNDVAERKLAAGPDQSTITAMVHDA